MSKDWKERKVIYTEGLWAQMEEWEQEINILAGKPEAQGSECVKLMLQGRREVISWVTNYLLDYEQRISEILDFWDVTIVSDEGE